MRYSKLMTVPALAAALALGACGAEEEGYEEPALEEPAVADPALTEPVANDAVLAEPNAEPLEPSVLEETAEEGEEEGVGAGY